MSELRVITNRSHITDERDSKGLSQDLLIRATVVAPDQELSTARRLPLHIAIVIDRSGSMSGRKLDDAIAAAQRMVQRLDDEDRCVVVTFDNDVSVLADGAPLSDARRTMIGHALSLVRPGGSTNLAGGWDEGVRLLLQHHVPNECISRVVILTDGAANVGLRDTEGLASQAKIYADRGVSTSTYGLGAHYNEATLSAMSHAGLGNHQFIEQSSDIDGFFGRELSELFSISMTDAVLTVDIPAGYSYELIGGHPHTQTAQQMRIDIGALVALEQRSFFFRLTPLSLSPHGAHQVRFCLTGTDTAHTAHRVEALAQWELTTAAQALASEIRRDVEQEAALIDLARVRAEANRLNQEGRYTEARSFVYAQKTRSVVFSQVAHYDEAAETFSQPTSSAFRKTEAAASHMRRRASSKDLIILTNRLAELIRIGAPASEIAAVQAEITRFEQQW